MKKQLCILIITITLAAAVSEFSLEQDFQLMESLKDQPKELFKQYHRIFEKHSEYSLESDAALARYKIFKHNLKWINQENKKHGYQKYGINQFLDLTDEEYHSKYLMKTEVLEQLMGVESSFGNAEDYNTVKQDVTEFSWMEHLFPTRSQGSCGSCWAFAAVNAIEGNYAKQFGEKKALSEQYFVSCSEKDNGCRGGWPSNTLKFAKAHGVLEAEKKKYTRTNGVCESKDKEKAKNSVTGYEFCAKCKAEDFLNKLSKGVLIVAVDASNKQFRYAPHHNPIINPDQGSCKRINHAITAVGIKLINGKPHIILRNSWGLGWGKFGNGYIPIDNNCFVMFYAWLPTVQKVNWGDDDKPNPPNPPTPTQECPVFFSSCDRDNSKTLESCTGIIDSKEKLGGNMLGWMGNEKHGLFNFFSDKNCRGTKSVRKSDERCFADNENTEEGSSFRSAAPYGYAKEGHVDLFTNYCFTGESASISGSIPDIETLSFSLSKVKSIRFCEGNCRLILFKGKNYTGDAFSLKPGVYFNIKVSRSDEMSWEFRRFYSYSKKVKSLMLYCE